MNVREMHIEVQQSLQQVAANKSRKFLDEEIDWVLNKQMDRFIQGKLRPKTDGSGRPTGGFEIDQLQADAIRALLVTNVPLTPYFSIADPLRYKCFLPADYKYLIADSSLTTNLCGKTPDEVDKTLYITRLRQDYSAKGAAPYYQALVANIAAKTVTIPADLPYGNTFNGYPEKADISFLAPWILWKSGWYWERFDDQYFPQHYINVQEVNTGSAALSVDGTDVSTLGVTTKAYKTHPGNGTFWANRLVPSEIIPNIRTTAFWKPSYYSPVTELAGNTLWVYRDSSFTVNSVFVTYIRKPQPISLSLNTDCELAPDFHQTICDLAVEYLKGRVENDKGVALTKTDLVERVIL